MCLEFDPSLRMLLFCPFSFWLVAFCGFPFFVCFILSDGYFLFLCTPFWWGVGCVCLASIVWLSHWNWYCDWQAV